MLIEFKSKSLEKVCTNAAEATKKYGDKMAEKIDQRMGEIEAFDSVESMIQYHIGRCHALTGNRKEQYAVDLVHPYRLVFEKKDNQIQVVKIMEIVDYH